MYSSTLRNEKLPMRPDTVTHTELQFDSFRYRSSTGNEQLVCEPIIYNYIVYTPFIHLHYHIYT